MKGKPLIQYMFLLLFLSCSTADKSIKYDLSTNNACEVLISLSDKLKTLNYKADQKVEEEIIDWVDFICSKEIKDTMNYHFGYLLKRIEEANKLDIILPSIINKTNAILLEIVVNELRFRALVAIQHNLVQIYHRLPANQKFSNSIIFSSTNSEISQTKTYLIYRQIGIISSIQNNHSKFRCWLALSRMLNVIDIPMSETGDQIIQRSPYGIMITEGEIFEKLQSLIDEETEEKVREYAKQTVELIRSFGSKYEEFESEIVIEDLSDLSAVKMINEKAVIFFNNALSSLDNNQKIELYSKAIEIDSNFIAAFNNRGISFFENKDYNSAINDFHNVLRLDSSKIIAYYYIGNSCLKIENYESAIHNYSQALQYGFSETSIYINRGLCYHKLGNYTFALEDFSNAINKDSTSTSAFTSRALLCGNKGL